MTPISRRHKVLGGFLAVVAVLWALDTFYGGAKPKAVSAAGLPQGPTPVAGRPPAAEPPDDAAGLPSLAQAYPALPHLGLDTVRRDLFVPTTLMSAVYEVPDVAVGDASVTDRPAADAVPFEQRYRLQGVVTGRVPFAVVNGTPLPLGAPLEGRTLVEIHREHVVFQRGGSRVVLLLDGRPR